ncbi:hypothetical protein AHAS_Ahas09G0121100 [Arachis hypogaea]
MARIYGDWEESYSELPHCLFAMQMYLPGTWVQLVKQSLPDFADTVMFHQCINTVMKDSRNLPITALFKSSYFRLGELFARKGFEALAQLQVSGEFSQTLMKAIEFNSKHVNTMNVYQFDRSRTNFTVEEISVFLVVTCLQLAPTQDLTESVAADKTPQWSVPDGVASNHLCIDLQDHCRS